MSNDLRLPLVRHCPTTFIPDTFSDPSPRARLRSYDDAQQARFREWMDGHEDALAAAECRQPNAPAEQRPDDETDLVDAPRGGCALVVLCALGLAAYAATGLALPPAEQADLGVMGMRVCGGGLLVWAAAMGLGVLAAVTRGTWALRR